MEDFLVVGVIDFLRSQFIKNKVPRINAGPAIINEYESIYHSEGYWSAL